MSASLTETIGSLRADLRRVEITLATRIDARAAANASWLCDEVRREREELFAELDRFREDVARCLADTREELRRHFDAVADGLRLDIRLLAERLDASEAGAAKAAARSTRLP